MIARSAASAGAATMTSRVLGLVRDQVLAYLFGTGAAMDAYNVAFRIPNLLRDLFAEGAMSAAFVPTFTRYVTTIGKPAAWRLGNLVINALLVVTGTVVVLGEDVGPLGGVFRVTDGLTRDFGEQHVRFSTRGAARAPSRRAGRSDRPSP